MEIWINHGLDSNTCGVSMCVRGRGKGKVCEFWAFLNSPLNS